MITRNIKEKILPKALPLAVGFSIVYSPYYSLEAVAQSTDIAPATLSMEAASDSPDAPVSSIARKAPKSLTKKSSHKKSKKETPAPIEDPIIESNNSASVESAADSRVKELVYNESNVYVIRAKYGYQTNVVFDPKEEVETISIGDRSLWQIIPAGNRIFIRPLTNNLSTNMTLITNKHSYEFDLKSVSENNDSNVYVLKFTYPEANPFAHGNLNDRIINAPKTEAIAEISPVTQNEIPQENSSIISPSAKASLSEAAKPESIGLLPIRFNYSYTYSGPDAIAPTQVYDDGKSTFIKYRSIDKEVPEAFIIESNGSESRVPATVQGSSLIINAIAPELALRGADGEIRVYNESLSAR